MDGTPVTPAVPSSTARALLEATIRWSIATTRRCAPVPHAAARRPTNDAPARPLPFPPIPSEVSRP
jgi:hypothetical protein